jgi:Subtilisin-like serine proteases
MKGIALCVLLSFFFCTANAQLTRYIIRFKNKGNNTYTLANPSAYLSQRALDRRTRYHIAIDSLDLPVTRSYIDSVLAAGSVTLLNVSKWLNSITIRTTDATALNKIRNFSFVITADSIAARTFETGRNKQDQLLSNFISERMFGTDSYYNYGQSFQQIHIHSGEFLHDIGLRGQSMILSMLDAGYNNYTSLSAFDSVNANAQILGVYDFVDHDNSVVEDNAHGMECFSTIAANLPGQFVGSAPKADFYLFRTEDVNSEYPIEEHNWVCGAEKADSAGTDVISSSLGYTTFDNTAFNHTYADMDGKTTIAAKGATIAARKGMLVFNSAGNDGANSWHYISTPGDADSIVTVAAVSTTGQPASFSSFGPSSDGRIKPDVASVGQGTIVETPTNTIAAGSGTSFACPNIAGLGTCLWQGFQELNNIKIIQALQQASNLATAPDNHIGYGIPDMKKATLILLKQLATSSASVSNCISTINWSSKDLHTMIYEIERKLPDQGSFVKIGTIAATGTSFNMQSYQFKDTLTNAQAGTIDYRIREVIDTSVAGFSADYVTNVSVILSSSCITTGIVLPANGSISISLVPNPASSEVNIILNRNQPIKDAHILITDAIGRKVYQLNTSLSSGISTLTVPVNNFAKSKYFVRIYSNSTLLGTSTFIKL